MKAILAISFLCVFVLASEICLGQDIVDPVSNDLGVLEKLQGKWQMDEKSVIKEMKLDSKEKHEKMPNKEKEEFEASIASKIYSFTIDGVFNAQWISRGTKQQVSGKYFILSKDLIRIVVNGKLEQFLIEELTETTITLKAQSDQRGMLNKLVFNRIAE